MDYFIRLRYSGLSVRFCISSKILNEHFVFLIGKKSKLHELNQTTLQSISLLILPLRLPGCELSSIIKLIFSFDVYCYCHFGKDCVNACNRRVIREENNFIEELNTSLLKISINKYQFMIFFFIMYNNIFRYNFLLR